MEPIKVVVNGAYGNVSREVVKAVIREPGMKLVGALEAKSKVKQNHLVLDGLEEPVPLYSDPDSLFKSCSADVLVDFTNAAVAMATARVCLSHGVYMVTGSTGFTEENLDEIAQLCSKYGVGAIETCNFCLGLLLMKHLAHIAAAYYDYAEITERHLDNKVDAPSATSLTMAEAIASGRGKPFICPGTERTALPNTRGGEYSGISIHSTRSPGIPYSTHEILFSMRGESLLLRQETQSTAAYNLGVMAAIREVRKCKGLVRGWVPWSF